MPSLCAPDFSHGNSCFSPRRRLFHPTVVGKHRAVVTQRQNRGGRLTCKPQATTVGSMKPSAWRSSAHNGPIVLTQLQPQPPGPGVQPVRKSPIQLDLIYGLSTITQLLPRPSQFGQAWRSSIPCPAQCPHWTTIFSSIALASGICFVFLTTFAS